jgi:hypothetical protein
MWLGGDVFWHAPVSTSPTFACLNHPYSSSISSLDALGRLFASTAAASNWLLLTILFRVVCGAWVLVT